MGLDSVDLVLRIESTFNIKLANEDTAAVRTVQDLYVLVRDKLEHSSISRSRQLFLHLRVCLIQTFELKNSLIRPSTQLEELLPRANRATNWEKLAQALGHQLPRLQLPPWLSRVLTLPFLIGCLAGFGTCIRQHSFLSFALCAASGVALTIIGFLVMRRFATHLPPVASSPRHLTGFILQSVSPNEEKWSESDLWTAFIALIADQLSIPPDEILPESRFIEDLKID